MVGTTDFSKASESDNLESHVLVFETLFDATLALWPLAILISLDDIVNNLLEAWGNHRAVERGDRNIESVEDVRLYEVSILIRNFNLVRIFNFTILWCILAVQVLFVISWCIFELIPADIDNGLEQAHGSQQHLIDL